MQALRKVLESVYSYFRYDLTTYIANQLEQETESTATCNVSRIQPQARIDSDNEEIQSVLSPKNNKVGIETGVEKKARTKTISNFTVENILMNHPHSSSNSSHSPSSTSSSLTSPTDYSSVLPGNWISHPPVKYTKYTNLSPGSMGDDKTRKKNKVDSTTVSNSRQRYHSSSAEGSSSLSEPLTIRRVPSNPITRVPSGEQLHYNFSSHPFSANGHHHHHHHISKLVSSEDHKPVQTSSFTQSRQILTKSVATLPVIQAVSYSPSGKPALLQQAFPPSQQFVLLVPSTSTASTSDGLQAVVYANQALTSQSPKLSISEQMPESNNHSSSNETDKHLLDTYRPIAPKNKPFRELPTMPTSTSFDKKVYKRSPTTGKPQKLRFHMTTVVKRPKNSVMTSSMTVESPSSINERTKTTSFIMDSHSSAETHITKTKNNYRMEKPSEMPDSTDKGAGSPQSTTSNDDSLATGTISDQHTSPNASPPTDNKKDKLKFVHCHEDKQFDMPPNDNGRTTRSYTKRKRELTFHLYGDPETAFKPKRSCKE